MSVRMCDRCGDITVGTEQCRCSAAATRWFSDSVTEFVVNDDGDDAVDTAGAA